jgi:hypothetical protein
MLQVDRKSLPSSFELPDSDRTPVDDEDQNWLPNVLLLLLKYIWGETKIDKAVKNDPLNLCEIC